MRQTKALNYLGHYFFLAMALGSSKWDTAPNARSIYNNHWLQFVNYSWQCTNLNVINVFDNFFYCPLHLKLNKKKKQNLNPTGWRVISQCKCGLACRVFRCGYAKFFPLTDSNWFCMIILYKACGQNADRKKLFSQKNSMYATLWPKCHDSVTCLFFEWRYSS